MTIDSSFFDSVDRGVWPCVVLRKGTTRTGACGLIRFNTVKLTKFRHSEYWQIDSSLLIQWIAWPFFVGGVICQVTARFCVYREKEERREKKEEHEREKSRLIAGSLTDILPMFTLLIAGSLTDKSDSHALPSKIRNFFHTTRQIDGNLNEK